MTYNMGKPIMAHGWDIRVWKHPWFGDWRTYISTPWKSCGFGWKPDRCDVERWLVKRGIRPLGW